MSTYIKWDYEDVKKYIKDNNYKVYSKKEDYTNTKSKILMECPSGHVVEIAFSNFKLGGRCKHCWKLNRNSGFHKKNLVLKPKK